MCSVTWLYCSNVLPLRGEQQATDYTPAKAYPYLNVHFWGIGKTIMGKYFGTDGFRGEAGITLTADHAYKVGRFLG
jgi:hypothetical protein